MRHNANQKIALCVYPPHTSSTNYAIITIYLQEKLRSEAKTCVNDFHGTLVIQVDLGTKSDLGQEGELLLAASGTEEIGLH